MDDNYLLKLNKGREGKFQRGECSIFDEIKFRLYGAGLCRNLQINHFLVTLLHAVNCCLIYRATGSMLATMLYLFNPVMNQTSIWMNGRRYAVGIFCVLLAWNFKLFFLPLYIFSAWLHIYTIAFPVMLFFTDYWPYALAGVVLAFFVARKPIVDKFLTRIKDYADGNELQAIRPAKLILYVKSIGFYFWHTLIPNKPRMYHEFLYYFSRYEKDIKEGYSFNFEFFKGMAALSFICYELFVNQNIWAAWFLVFISQYCNIVTVTQNCADRYCSLAGIGLMAILAKYLAFLPSPYFESAVAVIFTFYILRYLPLFRAYRSIEDFHLYHIRIDPSGVESRALQAANYMQGRDPFRAFALIKDGLRYRPKDFKLLFVFSQVLFAMGKGEDGIKILDIAQKNVPLGDEEHCKVEFENMKKHYAAQLNKPIMNVMPSKDNFINRQQRRAYERKYKKMEQKQEKYGILQSVS